MPKVSVIVPIYGVERYIERCAISLFEQTLDDIEYIFIDDCSPDRSTAILKQVLSRYPERQNQVIIHSMDKNSGQAKVRAWGISQAHGDYIIHCDSDDWVDVMMYEEMYKKAIEEASDVVICDYQEHNGNEMLHYRRGCSSLDSRKQHSDMLYLKVAWSLWNKLFKAEMCKQVKFLPLGNMGEDMLLCLQMMFYSKKISYISKPFYYYFFNTNSIVNTNTKENAVKKFGQNNLNLILLNQFYDSLGVNSAYKKELQWLSYFVKSILFIGDPCLQDYIKKIYPNIELKVMFNSEIDRHVRYSCFKNYIKEHLSII